MAQVQLLKEFLLQRGNLQDLDCHDEDIVNPAPATNAGDTASKAGETV